MNRNCLLSAVAGLTLMLAGIFVPFMKDAVDAGLAGSARSALAANDVTGVRVKADWASLTLKGHASARRPALAAVRGMAHGAAVHTVTYVGTGTAPPAKTRKPANVPAPENTPAPENAAALGKDRVTFPDASAGLTPRAKAVLGRAAALLDRAPGLTVTVTGYTDSQGGAPANRALSLARARAVRRYLAARGVAGGRMKAAGLGETSPAATNATAAGRAANRRVEFTVQGS